jgi:DNA topoisomerase I
MATKQTEKSGKSVIIVESPAKTRTLQHFLGKDYEILASMGHVRDLPPKGMGVDIANSFAPTYDIIPQRKPLLTKIRQAVKAADRVYLASDPDREGEAISWHLAEALKLKNPLRLEFHEITSSAVNAALANPRPIDMHRVEAQQARRILDRLVGYTISPLLNRKSAGRARSAGRVQSVAVRLVVEREREVSAFLPEEFWNLEAWLAENEEGEVFSAKAVKRAGEKAVISGEEAAQSALEEVWNQNFFIKEVKVTQQLRNAPPPFITSTLQQEASGRLGYSPRRTMALAQQLYEGLEMGQEGPTGLITYMRTDSVQVAEQARTEAKSFIGQTFGDDYCGDGTRKFRKAKGAQEAHEAIRPTSVLRRPEDLEDYLESDQLNLYRLIWNRFVASQMASVRLAVRTLNVAAGDWEFEAKEVKIAFPGFSLVYPIRDKEILLPAVEEGDSLYLSGLTGEQHFTSPPARYTEASLVKALEANGIGRPSTYAPILETIRARSYVYLDGERHLRPTDLGFAVTEKLIEHFPQIMEVKFTAEVEENLDKIEEGESKWQEVLKEFYDPFAITFDAAKEKMDAIRLPGLPTDEVCETCGKPMVLRTASQGPFLACSGYPECKTTKSIITGVEGEAEKRTCEKCGKPMVMRRSRFGPFWGCSGYPECTNTERIKGASRGGFRRGRKADGEGKTAGKTAGKKPAGKAAGKTAGKTAGKSGAKTGKKAK